MIVTRLEEVTKSRYKVYLDEQFAFVLYKGELSRFSIKEGAEVTLELYEKIKKEVVLIRAKKRLLHLLEQMPRTEQQLRTKMKQNFYQDDIIEAAIEYAKSFGYIDDENYIEMYIRDKMNTKSKKELYCALLKRGIQKEAILKVLDQAFEYQDETVTIKKIVEKKKYNAVESTEKDRQKLYAHLMRKGFSYEDISRVIREMDCEYYE